MPKAAAENHPSSRRPTPLLHLRVRPGCLGGAPPGETVFAQLTQCTCWSTEVLTDTLQIVLGQLSTSPAQCDTAIQCTIENAWAPGPELFSISLCSLLFQWESQFFRISDSRSSTFRLGFVSLIFGFGDLRDFELWEFQHSDYGFWNYLLRLWSALK